ncbi:MAG: L-aspartate oxidase [Elusimicrobia bacterium]|nr:L-aspartate oxidase [Elusimicrobiota bacterium]
MAGLSFALRAGSLGRVLVVTKKEVVETNTNYAQGGLAAALDPTDSPQNHIQDTLDCGDGLSEEAVVRRIVEDAPRFVRELEEWGVRFTRKNQKILDLGLEGGHSTRRIVHAKDFTGREIERALVAAIRKNREIQVEENTLLLDLILERDPDETQAKDNRCLGAVLFKAKENRTVICWAKTVVLATGGAGKIYLYTTNPEIATGDGFAVGYRAGLTLENMEFVQFHPTCLYQPKLRNFLISEAVRGEGAILRNQKGQAFMKAYDPRGELASRDIVARAIDAEMKKSGDEYVYLDITHKEEAFLKNRFPNIFSTLLSVGINMAKDSIPVVPAAHYFCGGVKADISGKTQLSGLYAIGEVAGTGFHGANRLASNSLLEAWAMAAYAAEAIKGESGIGNREAGDTQKGFVPVHWGKKDLTGLDENALIAHHWDEVRRLMSNYVGVVRSEERLKRALRRLSLIREEVEELARNFAPTCDLLELLNIVEVAGVVVSSALTRQESRGLHYRLDFPKKENRLALPTEMRKGRVATVPLAGSPLEALRARVSRQRLATGDQVISKKQSSRDTSRQCC